MFFLSWKQLTSRKLQTSLILLGISLGTLLFVVISGLQLGTRDYISDALLNNTSHVIISGSAQKIEKEAVTKSLYPKDNEKVRWVLPPFGRRKETRLENYLGWHKLLSNDSDVLDFAPRFITNAILSNGDFTTSLALIGTDIERQIQISSIESYMAEGSFKALSGGGNSIVIGSGVAEDLGVRVNQYVQISTGKQTPRPFKVVGITHFGNEQADRSMAFGELQRIQSLARSPGRVSQIAVALYDIELATQKAEFWRLFSNDKVEDWQEANKMFMEMIRVQDYSRYFITTAILIVAAFGIYNVLTIMINQKRREIAILRALGFNPGDILELILYEGMLLGISGGILGLIFGALACKAIESIQLDIQIGKSNNLLVSYHWSIYLYAFIAANIASIIASYIPARAASKMTPIEIIREE